MQDVFDYLTLNTAQNSRMRITSLYYDADDDEYRLIFSVSPGNRLTPYVETDLESLRDRIPIMNDNDSVVVVETLVDYMPPFDTGLFNLSDALGSSVFDEFVVTPPRFRTAICLQAAGCPVGI
jgi:hypothetical protein